MAVDTATRASQTEGRPAESTPLHVWLMAMTVTTGLVDAVSVLGLGRVFTANMTGNIVFLGLALAGIRGFSVIGSSVSLCAFFVGAIAGGRLAKALENSRRRWLLSGALFESVLFVAAAVASGRYDYVHETPTAVLYAVIALTALAMGVRNTTVRRLNVPDVTTTVLTWAITGLGADSRLAGGTRSRWGRRLASVVALLTGAAVGAVMVRSGGLVAALALTAAITLAATGAYAWRLASRDGQSGRSPGR